MIVEHLPEIALWDVKVMERTSRGLISGVCAEEAVPRQ
jgi:hypothetical protein